MNALEFYRRARKTASSRWLRYQGRRDKRVEFHDAAWRWPATHPTVTVDCCRCATREYPHLDPGCSRHGDLARTPATDSATVFVFEGGAASQPPERALTAT